jgi:hypothetical protein
MFLYFSDWTSPQNLEKLEERGFPHAGKLIKVFASSENPSDKIGRKLSITQVDDSPFEPDVEFKFQGRAYWTGSELEVYLDHFHLKDEEEQKARSLFRFANSPEMEITQLAMLARRAVTGTYHYNHPLAIIDGLDEARERGRLNGLHLDIFTQRSIDRLANIINLENTEGLVTIRESVELSKSTPEGSHLSKESL